jgi:hypothetical protein
VGAGANPSISTGALTAGLLTWTGFRDPTNSRPIIGSIGQGDTDGREPFYEWLSGHLTATKGLFGDVNFEDLIHIVEIVASDFGNLGPQNPAIRALQGYAADLFDSKNVSEAIANQNPAFIAAESSKQILRFVKQRRDQQFGNTDAANLLKRLKGERNTLLRVFSLNYETSVTDATATQWWTSYSPRPDGVEAFIPHAEFPRTQDLNIQLHGSIHFGLEFAGPESVARLRRYPNIADAEKSWGIDASHDHAQDLHVLLPVPMITGRRKADMIQLEPFASYFYYFRQAAMSTPRWLILGYGGSDPHVNSILASAAEKWASELRVAVCNFFFSGADANSSRVYLTRDRQRAAGTVYRALSAFKGDYYSFFKIRNAITAYIWKCCGTKLDRILLTSDGQYASNFDKICYWLKLT